QNYLKQYVPDYMLPAAFVIIDQIPLNANGKIDYGALPSPIENRLSDTQAFVAPRTPLERLLADIRQEVLKADKICIHNSFFELGGDSILSVRIVGKVKQTGYELTVQDLFLYPTIAQLVERLNGQEIQIDSKPISIPFSLISETEKIHIPADVEDAYPLAALQAGMLFHSQYDTDSAVYHNVSSYHLQMPYDEVLLQDTIKDLSELHPVLRTSFHINEFKEPLQYVHRQVQIPFTVRDIRHLSSDEQEMVIDELIETEKQKAFDWERAPLLRVSIHRRGNDTCNLTVTEHHAILDGWSVASLIVELSREYMYRIGGQLTKMRQAPPNLYYRDYIALEKEAVANETMKAFWLQQMDGASLARFPRLPKSHRTVSTNNRYELAIPSTLSRAIKQLADGLEVPFKTVLLAAHLRVINLFSGQTDVVTGLVTNGRPESEDGEKILGLFLNTLPFRLQLQQDESWVQLIQSTFQKEQMILKHRRYPLFEIQKTRQGQPLFETSFNFTHFHVYQGILETDRVKVLGFKGFEKTNFVLSSNFNLDLSTGDVQMYLCYNSDELGLNQIKRMALYYQQVLTVMTEHPREFNNNCLLPNNEVEHLKYWNATETDYPEDLTIVDLFESQVERFPDNVALIFENQQLSYRELNWRANQLAHYLISLKTRDDNGPLITDNCLVGICVDRSLAMVVGLLGILKAGGAYVPFDPDYPLERVWFMLEDSEVKVLLSQSHLQERLPQSKAKVVCLDSELQRIAGYSKENPARQSGPEKLAYVIYTSGSTGVPKGVMVEHAAITQNIAYSIIRYQIESSDNVLQFASLSFDASIEQIFSTLCGGARLVLISTNLLHNKAIQNIFSDEQITIANLPPVYWQQLLDGVNIRNLEQLKLLILGGDTLFSQLAQQTRQMLSKDKTLLNAYGPTEATITATLFEVTDQFEDNNVEKVTPIGQPIVNTKIYILNRNLTQTPLGVPGELCIAGTGLARGYLNRPELTAKKFIEIEIFGKRQRVYKTGDLARWLPDGNLEYLGRLDNQVKLRGFRIELGEIETILSQHEAVKEAVVALYKQEESAGLVVYVTLATQIDEVAGILRTWLKFRLPEYMVPGNFTVLEQMPLTPNGKIDRKALPTPGLSIHTEKQFPRTETEHLLCNLWTQVLGIEITSTLSNFFESGGHSLLATQLVSRIRESFSIEMPLRVVFEEALLQDQAEWLDKQQRGLELPPIVPLEDGESLVLSFAQQRLWFLAQLEGQSVTYNMPAALCIEGELNETALQDALGALIKRHDSLRLCFPIIDGEVTVELNDVYDPLSVTDLSELRDTEQQHQVTKWISEHAKIPFDLTSGSLLNLRLLKLNKQEQVLLFNMHHIISDGWSIGVLIREWGQLYNAYVQNQEPQLPKLSIQYTDYAAWQRNWFQGEILDRQLGYWIEKLTGIPELLESPTDYARPSVMSYKGNSLQSTLSLELTQGIKQL
ncbi:MAG: amino acid adenylation domain-containing protein, partial [Gammaproteobacteria bacterium]|nr:amino acid adenylation domain-containing protein [Gammaproteobacteria bacterium]